MFKTYAVSNMEIDLYNPFLNPFTSWLFSAGAGNAIWSGMVEDHVVHGSPIQERKVDAWRPALSALQRISTFLANGFTSIQRTVKEIEVGLSYRYTIVLNSSACLHAYWIEPYPILLAYQEPIVESVPLSNVCFPKNTTNSTLFPMINGTVEETSTNKPAQSQTNSIQYILEIQ